MRQGIWRGWRWRGCGRGWCRWWWYPLSFSCATLLTTIIFNSTCHFLHRSSTPCLSSLPPSHVPFQTHHFVHWMFLWQSFLWKVCLLDVFRGMCLFGILFVQSFSQKKSFCLLYRCILYAKLSQKVTCKFFKNSIHSLFDLKMQISRPIRL